MVLCLELDWLSPNWTLTHTVIVYVRSHITCLDQNDKCHEPHDSPTACHGFLKLVSLVPFWFQVDRVSYLLQEIYGIENKNNQETKVPV